MIAFVLEVILGSICDTSMSRSADPRPLAPALAPTLRNGRGGANDSEGGHHHLVPGLEVARAIAAVSRATEPLLTAIPYLRPILADKSFSRMLDERTLGGNPACLDAFDQVFFLIPVQERRVYWDEIVAVHVQLFDQLARCCHRTRQAGGGAAESAVPYAPASGTSRRKGIGLILFPASGTLVQNQHLEILDTNKRMFPHRLRHGNLTLAQNGLFDGSLPVWVTNLILPFIT